VRAHYADFGNIVAFRTIPAAMGFYISYRIANRIYWTAHKRPVPKGELVFSDGKHLARARCGNQLSLVAQEPKLRGDQPEETVLDDIETPTASVLDTIRPPLLLEDVSPLHIPALLEDKQRSPSLLASAIPGETAGVLGNGASPAIIQSTVGPIDDLNTHHSTSISDAPEPTTLGLFIAGFGAVLIRCLARKV
jgi:hypothetical protein